MKARRSNAELAEQSCRWQATGGVAMRSTPYTYVVSAFRRTVTVRLKPDTTSERTNVVGSIAA